MEKVVAIRHLAPSAGVVALNDPKTQEWIMSGLHAGEVAITWGQVLEGVLGGDYNVTQIYVDHELRAVLVLEVVDIGEPLERTVSVVSAGGSGTREWVHDMHDSLLRIAENLDARRLLIMGRPGWRRVMDRYGWSEVGTLIEYRVGRKTH